MGTLFVDEPNGISSVWLYSGSVWLYSGSVWLYSGSVWLYSKENGMKIVVTIRLHSDARTKNFSKTSYIWTRKHHISPIILLFSSPIFCLRLTPRTAIFYEGLIQNQKKKSKITLCTHVNWTWIIRCENAIIKLTNYPCFHAELHHRIS